MAVKELCLTHHSQNVWKKINFLSLTCGKVKMFTTGDDSTKRYTELMKSLFEPGTTVHILAGMGKYQGSMLSNVS